MANIAIFGGTFNPPTLAHEAIIQACLEQTGIDEVWLMPSGERTDKPDMLAASVRLKMLEAIRVNTFASNPRVKVSKFELNLPLPTMTYKTAATLIKTYPEHTFWFVFGADSYVTMATWEHGAALKKSLHMLIAPRVNCVQPPESSKIRDLVIPEVLHLHTSSTQVRQAVCAGASISHVVSPTVQEFIVTNKLYTTPEQAYN